MRWRHNRLSELDEINFHTNHNQPEQGLRPKRHHSDHPEVQPHREHRKAHDSGHDHDRITRSTKRERDRARHPVASARRDVVRRPV